MELTNKKCIIFNYITIPWLAAPVLLILSVLNKIITALIPMLQVIVTADFVDTVVSIFNKKSDRSAIFLPLIFLLLIIIYTNINDVLMGFINTKLDMKLMETFEEAVVEKRAKLEYWHIENNDTWEIVNRVCTNTSENIYNGFKNLLDCGDFVIQIASFLSLLFSKVWWAALVIIAFSVPLFYVSIKSGKTDYDAFKEANKYDRKADSLQNIISSRESVEERALFGYTDYCNEKWFEKYEIARKMELRASAKNTLKIKTASIITIIISMLISGVLINLLGKGIISIGMFIGLVTATFNMVQTISKYLSDVTSDIAKSMEYMKDLFLFQNLSETKDALDLPSINIGSHKNYTIEFKNVTFKYPGTEKYILKGFSMILHPNIHYAFVGINGAGKTTITKLLTGLYNNYSGDILVNGKNLKEFSASEIKGLFSVVYQDFAKYYIPLKDSVMLGDIHNISGEQKLKDALREIELTSMVTKLPKGIETPLGKIYDNGVDISGGEWQRIAIARTLVSEAPIIILDEPTAALDPIAESKLYELFDKISAGKSTIFITHRLGAAKLADEILVIDDGKVAQQGSHEALMKINGIYAQMFEKQRSWYN